MADELQTDRSKQLQTLAAQMPVANQQTAQALDAARKAQLQAQIAFAGQQGVASTVQPGLQLGAQQAQQQAQIAGQTAQQNQNDMVRMGQFAQENQQRVANREVADMQQGSQEMANKLEMQLGNLNRQVKNQLVDDQMRFQKDRAGQEVLNETQLADFALSQAKNANDLAAYEQAATQASQRQIQVLTAAHQKVVQEMQAEAQRGRAQLGQAQMIELTNAKNALEEKLRKAQAKAENTAKMWQAGGTVVGVGAGAAIGTFVLPGLGTAAGATAGAAVGGAIGSAVGTNTGKISKSLESMNPF